MKDPQGLIVIPRERVPDVWRGRESIRVVVPTGIDEYPLDVSPTALRSRAYAMIAVAEFVESGDAYIPPKPRPEIEPMYESNAMDLIEFTRTILGTPKPVNATQGEAKNA